MASASLPAGQVPTALAAAGLREGSTSDDAGRRAPSNINSDAAELKRLLEKHEASDVVTQVFNKHPMVLARALRSLDNNENVLYAFLDKHRHVVGRFLNQHKKIEVLADFLATYPAALHTILDEEPSIVENFLQQEPQALSVYLRSNPDVLRGYLTANPQRFHEFCDSHPELVTAWLKNRQNGTQTNPHQNASATVSNEVQPSPRQLVNTRDSQDLQAANTRSPPLQSAPFSDTDVDTPPPASDSDNSSDDNYQPESIIQSIEMSDNEVAPLRGSAKTIPGGSKTKFGGKTVFGGKGKGKTVPEGRGQGKTTYGGKAKGDSTTMTSRKTLSQFNTRSTQNRTFKTKDLQENNDITSTEEDDDDQDFKPKKSGPARGGVRRTARPTKSMSRATFRETRNKKQAKQSVNKRRIYDDSDEDEDFEVEEEEDTQEADDESSDSDDYDAGKDSRKRKKGGRSAGNQSNNNNTTATVNGTGNGQGAPAHAADRLLVPYPAPPAALAADAKKDRGLREWSLREEDCGIRHMLDIRDEDEIKGEERFKEAAERLNSELGTQRTKISFKNFWNRCGRLRSGFDERRRKTAHLATSLQNQNARPAPPAHPAVQLPAPAVKKALRKKTTKVKTVAAPNTTGQAESSSAASARTVNTKFEDDSDAEDEDARVARVLRELSSADGATGSTPDSADDNSQATPSSDTDAEPNNSFTRSVTTPQPRPRPGSADISPITPASSIDTPAASPQTPSLKRKSEESDDIDQDIIAFANGTRKKKKVNYTY